MIEISQITVATSLESQADKKLESRYRKYREVQLLEGKQLLQPVLIKKEN
jgi:hypothetical protein